jgi:hypothetical protein
MKRRADAFENAGIPTEGKRAGDPLEEDERQRTKDEKGQVEQASAQGLAKTVWLGIILGLSVAIAVLASLLYFEKKPTPRKREIADAHAPLFGVDEFCDL